MTNSRTNAVSPRTHSRRFKRIDFVGVQIETRKGQGENGKSQNQSDSYSEIPKATIHETRPVRTERQKALNTIRRFNGSRFMIIANTEMSRTNHEVKRLTSISVRSEKPGPHSQKDDAKIEHEAPVLKIVQVIFNAFADRGVSAQAIHLRPTSNADLQPMSRVVCADVLNELLDEVGPLGRGTD